KSFEKTLSYVISLKFDKVHVARYTQRPFTKAYILNGQVPEPEKKRRSKILSEAAAKAAHERNMLYLGKIFNALIEKASNREANARLLQNYKPVVIKEEKLKAGQIVRVKIERAEPYYLIGRLF
ncbi:MAG TPA: TRAM domain-containing protein, partial [Thermofilum sp.]|nr:TRAM domain-containing protein [Thermofilum sp.]